MRPKKPRVKRAPKVEYPIERIETCRKAGVLRKAYFDWFIAPETGEEIARRNQAIEAAHDTITAALEKLTPLGIRVDLVAGSAAVHCAELDRLLRKAKGARAKARRRAA